MSLLVLCLFLLYRLLNMFRATLCPSSGADDLEVFIRCVAERGCVGSQIRLVACLSIGKHLTQLLSASQWTSNQPDLPTQPRSATHLINTSKSSAPEDGHKVARNMLSNL